MIGTVFAVLVLLLFGLIILSHGGLWGIVLFGLALLTAISGTANAA